MLVPVYCDGLMQHNALKPFFDQAYSIPVVEALLQPLQNVFAIRNYEPFIYSYSWENPDNDIVWNSLHECKMTHV
jgi:hypothetical protein